MCLKEIERIQIQKYICTPSFIPKYLLKSQCGELLLSNTHAMSHIPDVKIIIIKLIFSLY